MTTTPATCSYCGVVFTEANPAEKSFHSAGDVCDNAWACVERKWAIEKAEKQREEKNDVS